MYPLFHLQTFGQGNFRDSTVSQRLHLFSARYFRMIIIFELFKLWPALDLEITLFTVNYILKAAILRLTYDESLIFSGFKAPVSLSSIAHNADND